MILLILLLGQLVDVAKVANAPSASPARRIEDQIAAEINRYRRSVGLPPVPRSPSLDLVARVHVADLFANRPDSGTGRSGKPCNAHSWSARGTWNAICFTGDHADGAGMWRKPAEITGGRYLANGFEIAMISPTPAITAKRALAIWRGSPAHEPVIAQRGDWAKYSWRAMGVGVGPYYAVVWFGQQHDPSGR